MTSTLTALADALANLFAAEGRPGGDEAARALAKHRADTPAPIRKADIDGAEIRAICGSADALPAAQAALDAWDDLGWRYPGLDKGMIPAPVAMRMLSCEVLGPDGPLVCPTCRVGLFGQLPGLDYTGRTHAAEETFITLVGEGEWTCAPDPNWHVLGPGGISHHPSGALHQSRTAEHAFLTTWRWTGDIGFESYSLRA